MRWAVRFEHVTKRYKGGGPRYSSLRHDISNGLRGLANRFHRPPSTRGGTLALDDVSFEVNPGESFAIVGPNGAGKTTALKMMTRISYPTSGRVCVRGRVGALIEVGSGIHPELSARENIWLYGQILGMSKGDLARKFDAIVDFAELSHALDTPVKMYSSGMQMRLGFAIASHLEPEIFVVDEALAVGDAGFQAKCVERMTQLVSEGRTLLFVSHNLSAAEAICSRAIFLHRGRVEAAGPTRDVLRNYLDWLDASRAERLQGNLLIQPSRDMTVLSVTCHDASGRERYVFNTGESLEVRLGLRVPQALERPHFSLGISDGRPGNLILCSMLVDGGAPDVIAGEVQVSCRMESLPLMPRVYEIWCSVRGAAAYGDILDWQPVGSFRMADSEVSRGPAGIAYSSTDAPIRVQHEWVIGS